jgi:4-amino-4-deoxy-L-arabinose transferase-like glycosyltransferase
MRRLLVRSTSNRRAGEASCSKPLTAGHHPRSKGVANWVCLPTARPAVSGELGVRTILLAPLFALILLLAHFPFLQLPYFWDEAGQFIPAALDLLHMGAWIPRSAAPNIHPPGVVMYLAAFWRLAGTSPLATRTAMLILAGFACLAAFLLSRELCRGTAGVPVFATLLLVCSPLFFAQSMLAQLDAPAMLFTSLALLLFVQDRMGPAVVASTALVLVKETGLAVALVFALWLIRERRFRDSAWFALPALALAVWIAALWHATGHWAGNAAFVRYNVADPLHVSRLLISLLRRLYYLFLADFRWIGTAAIVYAWRTTRLFASRSWHVAWVLIFTHVLLVTVFGGAVLDRYLLPVMPVVYTAMAAALALYSRPWRWICEMSLIGGVAAANWINPPYPAPFEDNLAFTDFIQLHQVAAAYLMRSYPSAQIQTLWPLTLELSRPELGFIGRPMAVCTLPDLNAPTLRTLKWDRLQVLVAFSRNWDPRYNIMHSVYLAQFWERVYSQPPDASREQVRALVRFPVARHFERRGQWVDIYVNPRYSEPTGFQRVHLAREK